MKYILNNPGLPLRDIKRRVLEADHLKMIEKSGNSFLSNLRPPLTMGMMVSMALLKLLCLTVFKD